MYETLCSGHIRLIKYIYIYTYKCMKLPVKGIFG